MQHWWDSMWVEVQCLRLEMDILHQNARQSQDMCHGMEPTCEPMQVFYGQRGEGMEWLQSTVVWMATGSCRCLWRVLSVSLKFCRVVGHMFQVVELWTLGIWRCTDRQEECQDMPHWRHPNSSHGWQTLRLLKAVRMSKASLDMASAISGPQGTEWVVLVSIYQWWLISDGLEIRIKVCCQMRVNLTPDSQGSAARDAGYPGWLNMKGAGPLTGVQDPGVYRAVGHHQQRCRDRDTRSTTTKITGILREEWGVEFIPFSVPKHCTLI